MKNLIELKFNSTVTMLAGYDYGKQIYESQVKGNLDLFSDFTIKFPDQIKRIASSFTQGFFREMVEEIGIIGIQERLKVISSKENLKASILRDLL